MGFIDSDAHVRESRRTWAHLEPAERHHAPAVVDGRWVAGGVTTMNGPYDEDRSPADYLALFPPGSVDLEDPGARIARMDALGVDVHVF